MNKRQRKKWLKHSAVGQWLDHVTQKILEEAGLEAGTFRLTPAKYLINRLSRIRRR